jgi:hypothetical protein
MLHWILSYFDCSHSPGWKIGAGQTDPAYLPMKRMELMYNTATAHQNCVGSAEREAHPPRPLNIFPEHVETTAPKRKVIPIIR